MRSRLKVVNHTHYQTADLRPVLLGAILDDGQDERRYIVTVKYARNGLWCSGHAYYGASGFQVNVPKSREVCVLRPHSECGACGTHWTKIDPDAPLPTQCPSCGFKPTGDAGLGIVTRGGRWVRKDYDVLPPAIVEDMARVALHELQHCAGKHHADMGDCYKRSGEARGGGVPTPWCEGLVVRKVAPPSKPTADERVRERAEKAEQGLQAWERRLKIAQGKVRKYRAKVRYYQGRAAAKTPGSV